MDSTTETLLVVAVALLVVYVSRKLFKQHKLNLPPGPTPLPVIGCLHLLRTHPQKNFSDLALKYGPLMSIRLGQRYCVVATSPEAAKEFLKVQDANFSSRPPIRAVKIMNPGDIAFYDLTPVTRHLRKILVSEFTSAKRLEASKYIRTEELAYMLQTISKAKGPILDALLAGTDTTMLTSEWAMAEVLRNLNCMVQESDIPQLKYIQAIVKEVLRLHPAVPLLVELIPFGAGRRICAGMTFGSTLVYCISC